MFVFSYFERKLLELDENKNIVNSYDVELGSEFTLPDGRIFVPMYGCIVKKNDNGDIIEYEKVFFDVREFFTFTYLQSLGGE